MKTVICLLLFHFMRTVKLVTVHNVTGGTYTKNKQLDSFVMLAFPHMGPQMCMKECLMHTNCNAVNFDKNNYICHLLQANYPGDALESSDGIFFSEKAHWKKDFDACWPNTCPPDTKCYVLYPDERFCHTYASPCDDYNDECQNGGICRNMANGFGCRCATGYYGEYCESTPCTSSPCVHGNCEVSGSGYTCNCLDGYYGDTCQNTPCTTQPCLNSGTCSIAGSSYTCNCPTGYSGTTCQNTPCTPQPCLNSGTCSIAGSSYTCNCPTGYSGTTCQNDPCHSQPCKNSGSCTVSGSGYTCSCTTGFQGTLCEVPVAV
ncbi:uncharacterized protein LOC143054727 isoform X1 [Mytilus galloprovincialis]|uniref:uncharacterized protein LOC143054727 isoform X1 n=1 Tax=Mytilus galloprovincialis TaxID=29158 RepID=UPI003F7CC328